jgi:hypothetical protein
MSVMSVGTRIARAVSERVDMRHRLWRNNAVRRA